MRVRESLLIIATVSLLSSTIYFVFDAKRYKVESEKAHNELTKYIKSREEAQKKEKESLALLQKEADVKLQKEKKEKQKQLRLEIKQRVEYAYALAHRLEKKYKGKRNKKYIILEALNQSGVYVKNYAGDSIGDVKSTYLRNGLRAVALEEIQKVRRRKEGYIYIKSDKSSQEEYIYVKDLQMDKLFIGANVIFG